MASHTEITDPLAGRTENPWAESHSDLTSTVTNGGAASVVLVHSSSSLAYFPDYVYDPANAETYPDYWESASFQTNLNFGYEMTIFSEYGNIGEILASVSAENDGFNFYEWGEFNIRGWSETDQDYTIWLYSWYGGTDVDIEVPLLIGETYLLSGSFGGVGGHTEWLGNIYGADTVDGYMEGLHLYDYNATLSINVSESPSTVVPEPSTFILVGIGLAGLVRSRRRAA
ncbi:MAG: PEP-CTERM sorting domain-containing protein [Candidatus Hydrogenedentes bacterium]|nr:PEP-CTERM sorting domain-containing protein [Candidatus Hydrogenedentota bacterium]